MIAAAPIPPLKRVVSGGKIPQVGLVRQASAGRLASGQSDWRTTLTIEERMSTRAKIRHAYKSHCASFEQLLDTVAALDEELLHKSASSRLDYFKAGLEHDRAVRTKRSQLQGELHSDDGDSADDGGESTDLRDSKRLRADHVLED